MGRQNYNTQKAQTITEKSDKLYFIEIKNFCSSKDTIKMNKQSIGQEIYFI